MPTTPRNHLIRLAASAVLPAFTVLGVALTHTGSANLDSANVNPSSVSSADSSVAPEIESQTRDQHGVSHSSPEAGSPTEATSTNEDVSGSKESASEGSADQAPAPTASSSPSSSTPSATPSSPASSTPVVKAPASRTPASQVPTHQVDNRADNRVGSQGADQAPSVTGPRRPGRAPLNTAQPAPTTSTPAPSTQTPAPQPAPVPEAAPTQSPAPTTSAPTTAAPTTSAPVSNSVSSNVENLLFNKVNAYRVSKGVAPLQRNATMDTMSRNWSTTMATTNNFAHNPDMRTQTPSGWTMIGENVAYCAGYGTDDEKVAQTLFMLWVNSPGHNANMLDARYNTGSMGIAKVGTGTYYATQNFARF